MKTTLITIATGIALLTGPLQAGGPVIKDTESAPVVVDDRKLGILPILIGIGILAVLASGGGNICNGDDPASASTPGGC